MQKKQTPHIVLPIGTFNTKIDVFVDLIDKNVVTSDTDKYQEFVKRYKNKEYHDTVSVLISEWANRGDLLDFIRKYHDQFSLTHWKVIFFQVLSVLAVIQSKYPSFRHNDLKANNLLVHKIKKQNEKFTYKVVRCVYSVPNIGYHVKLWDFDFSCIPGIVDNRKVESRWAKTQVNVTPTQNRYYDIHYFFNTLIKKGFCNEVMTSEKVPNEVKEFINRVVPKKYQKTGTEYVADKGRILVNDEYTTADELLKTDPFFADFRMFDSSKGTIKNTTVSSTKNAKETIIKKSMSKDKIKKKTSGMPDLTKFLKNDSISDDDDDHIKKILKGGSNSGNHKKHASKTPLKKKVIKSIKPEKNSKKKLKKNHSRTISEEMREIDPELLFNKSSSSS